MIKVWGRTDSSNVQKVLWCCDELGVPLERVDIGGRFGGNDEPAYRALNPNGLIPTIEDGGFVLWESNSIVRYLIDKYGPGQLLPATPEARAHAGRWMDWQLSTVTPAMVPLFWGLVRTPEDKRDPEAIDKALQNAGRVWQIVEGHLAKNRYLGGAAFSLGDIPVGVWVHRWYHLPIRRPETPHLKAWYDRLSERPPYRTHVMIPIT